LKRQLQQERNRLNEKEGKDKEPLLGKHHIAAPSLSFDEVRNYLENGQGDTLLGKISLGEVRRKFQKNETALEDERAQALLSLQQERNMHMNNLTSNSKEARQQKVKAEEKLVSQKRGKCEFY
jgi:hypothetical protein